MQPWRAYKTDGVILFSDILTPLPGMGIDFDILEKEGPKMPPLRTKEAIDAGFKAFEVVQGRPYTPLKSKAVEDAVKPIATSAINIYKATESAAKAAPTFTPKLTKTLEKAYKDAPSVSAKLGQQAQTAPETPQGNPRWPQKAP